MLPAMCFDTDSRPPLPPIRGGAHDARHVELTSRDGTRIAAYAARADTPSGAGIAVIASVVVLWLLRRGGNRVYCTALALIMGGALGNLWDRLVIGEVVDFLLFHWGGWSFPAFNVADSAITVGAALLILDSLVPRPAKES